MNLVTCHVQKDGRITLGTAMHRYHHCPSLKNRTGIIGVAGHLVKVLPKCAWCFKTSDARLAIHVDDLVVLRLKDNKGYLVTELDDACGRKLMTVPEFYQADRFDSPAEGMLEVGGHYDGYVPIRINIIYEEHETLEFPPANEVFVDDDL